jgi:hypothetical protein
MGQWFSKKRGWLTTMGDYPNFAMQISTPLKKIQTNARCVAAPVLTSGVFPCQHFFLRPPWSLRLKI